MPSLLAASHHCSELATLTISDVPSSPTSFSSQDLCSAVPLPGTLSPSDLGAAVCDPCLSSLVLSLQGSFLTLHHPLPQQAVSSALHWPLLYLLTQFVTAGPACLACCCGLCAQNDADFGLVCRSPGIECDSRIPHGKALLPGTWSALESASKLFASRPSLRHRTDTKQMLSHF